MKRVGNELFPWAARKQPLTGKRLAQAAFYQSYSDWSFPRFFSGYKLRASYNVFSASVISP